MNWDKDKETLKKRNRVLAAAIAAVLLLMGIAGVLVYRSIQNETIEDAGRSHYAYTTLMYNGQEKTVRPYIRTVLVIGTDNYSGEQRREDGFYNYAQADFLALLVLDLKNKTVTPIQINRDTMCEVPWLSVNGKIGGTNFEQITLAHTSGSGGHDSCQLTADTVSSLLFGAPVDDYMAFTMDAVPVMTDLVGGVEVSIDEDLTDINESFTQGTKAVLRGEEALRYVRVRSHDRVDANLPRLSRHREYLNSFLYAARKTAEENGDLITESYEQLSPYLTTSLTFDNYADLANWLRTFEIRDIQTPEGEYRSGEYAEFYPDMEELWNIVTEAFC